MERAQRSSLQLVALLLLTALAACASGERATKPVSAPRAQQQHAQQQHAHMGAVGAPVAIPPAGTAAGTLHAGTPVLIVSDPELLALLQAQGFDLGSTWLGTRALSTRELAGHAPYRALVAAIAGDLASDARRDPKAGVGMRYGHRQFDLRWLDSEAVRFDLVAVVNRVDRRVFEPGFCGETRFVYRLAYQVQTASGPIASRLPLTLNVVDYSARDGAGSCAEHARRWLEPSSARSAAERIAWLLSERGPLAPSVRAAATPKSLELNFQSVRWPSTVRPKMAGHAEYGLRAFARTKQPPFLVPLPLENTVDAARVAGDPRLRAELLALLRAPATLQALDQGTLRVPERFLAQRAVSVSPHGLARDANRPWKQLLRAGELAGLELAGYRTIATPAALLRRLDTLSCQGCHQSRSLAGFHMLGVEPESDLVDAIAVPMSPHLHADLDRRAAYLLALAEGREPSEQRAPAERGDLAEPPHAHHAGMHHAGMHAHRAGAHSHAPPPGGRGEHCGLGDPGFADWTCAPGLRCARMGDDEVGACVPEQLTVGDPCEPGTMRAASDPHRDAMSLQPQTACRDGRVCEVNGVGFPGGMCAGRCDDLPDGAVCGGIALLREFNACLAARTPFDRCLADNTRPGALQACDPRTPCRDDYVCVRSGSHGACLPPYFLFQARVDGHPL